LTSRLPEPVSVVALAAALILASPQASRAQHEGAHHASPAGEDPGAHSHAHGRTWDAGSWRIAAHGFANTGAVTEGGPRGDSDWFLASMFGATASHDHGAGSLELGAMFSLDPVMGPEGYPLLLQTGETADGVRILFDRQHPHDLFMLLGARYRVRLGSDASASVSVAYPGEPALGPPAFVHRASAASTPLAPTTHHWMDSTHVAWGVVTAGFALGPLVLEGSAFKGAEPDEKRWNFDPFALDSWSGRVSVRFGAGIEAQVSGGRLKEPEFAHPGVDVTRWTASLAHSVGLGGDARLDSTLVWGSNRRDQDITSQAFQRFPPARRSDAWLLESRLRWSAQNVAVRVGWAEKDELFPLDHPFHGRLFPTTRVTASYLVEGPGPLPGWAALGASGSLARVPEELQAFYGPRTNALTAFLRFELR